MGGLLHLVQRRGDWAGRSPPRPPLAVPNVTAHPSTASVPITVLLCNSPLLSNFNVGVKRLNVKHKRCMAAAAKWALWYSGRPDWSDVMSASCTAVGLGNAWPHSALLMPISCHFLYRSCASDSCRRRYSRYIRTFIFSFAFILSIWRSAGVGDG